ncbi:enhancer of mRNA decapping [Quaeritorhiza haematococci]|nr:enhancer of mRNA decapping [Quaeritorhiza haematococci]
MAAEFIGLDVRVQLKNGILVDGRVSAIDQITQAMTLRNVSTIANGAVQNLPTYQISGLEIADLQIMSKKPLQQPVPPPPSAFSRQQGPTTEKLLHLPPPPTPPSSFNYPATPTHGSQPQLPQFYQPQPREANIPSSSGGAGQLPISLQSLLFSNQQQQQQPTVQSARPSSMHTPYSDPAIISMSHPKPPSFNASSKGKAPSQPAPTMQSQPSSQPLMPLQTSKSQQSMLNIPSLQNLTESEYTEGDDDEDDDDDRDGSRRLGSLSGVRSVAGGDDEEEVEVDFQDFNNYNHHSHHRSSGSADVAATAAAAAAAAAVIINNSKRGRSSAAVASAATAAATAAATNTLRSGRSSSASSRRRMAGGSSPASAMSHQSKSSRSKSTKSQKSSRRDVNGRQTDPRSSTRRSRNKRGHYHTHEWADGDVSDYSKDFDFEASLGQFDKQKIFAEIRELDDTAPETLLVNLNRRKQHQQQQHDVGVGHADDDEDDLQQRSQLLPPPPMSRDRSRDSSYQKAYAAAAAAFRNPYYQNHASQRKMGIREMVLDPAPSGDETGNDAEVESEVETDLDVGGGRMNIGVGGAFSPGVGMTRHQQVSLPPDRIDLGNEVSDEIAGINSGSEMMARMSRTPTASGQVVYVKRPHFQTLSGVRLPAVTMAEMADIERIAVTETGPNHDQMVENGGRGAAMLVLQALGGARRLKPGNHNAAPHVVVLVGSGSRVGAFGLAAARHLVNHECSVTVLCTDVGGRNVVDAQQDGKNVRGDNSRLESQRRMLLAAGARIVSKIGDLPKSSTSPVDLIIDSLIGSGTPLPPIPTSGPFAVSPPTNGVPHINTSDRGEAETLVTTPTAKNPTPKAFGGDSATPGDVTEDEVRSQDGLFDDDDSDEGTVRRAGDTDGEGERTLQKDGQPGQEKESERAMQRVRQTQQRNLVDLVQWVSSSKAPVLSLEAPSGLVFAVGDLLHIKAGLTSTPLLTALASSVMITPKWTLAFGLPKTLIHGLPREITGDLFLADVGLPKLVYQKVNIARAGSMDGGSAGAGGGDGSGSVAGSPVAPPGMIRTLSTATVVRVGGGGDEERESGVTVMVKGRLKYTPPFGDKFLVALEAVTDGI